MTDEQQKTGMRPGSFDDDRLLACALGLDDDAELLAAAGDDAALAARLEAMRADVAQIGAHVAAAVPAPDESYTDLSGERWSGLNGFFGPPASVATPRRKRRWWRVVAPVAALAVLALVVGIVAADQGGFGSSSGSSAEVARTSDDAAAPYKATGGDDGTNSGAGSGEATPGATTASPGSTDSSPRAVESSPAERFVDQLDRFAVVVLARARAATGAIQRFAVLRIFKGRASKIVELAVDGRPADEGRLHLLMLDPTPSSEPQSESLSPEPVPSLAAVDGPGEPLAVAYTYRGEPTMVREFAAGTDPNTVSLTLP